MTAPLEADVEFVVSVTQVAPDTSAAPVTDKRVPEKVKFVLSSNSPFVPANEILPDVKSHTCKLLAIPHANVAVPVVVIVSAQTSSIHASSHFLPDSPKLYVSLQSGTKLVLNSPDTVTQSVSVSPNVTLPLSCTPSAKTFSNG